ncbi:MAG: 16S rRNA (cytidine(1402)-2'-O)-methyltransferase [Pseudomonadales bacterium]|jgi:16S rRNA (cytidine1402-2'-O)-methyltransferase|nr:16S rRNA (cytidine(1402)-2'-O)-methyltransferase [Pseudomonadales bacterium]
MKGCLYIVATPIGNLADLSQRALEVLRSVALVAAEDTRHSARLLQAYGITTPMLALHEHNEAQRGALLCERIESGERIALISDAGTPLISDPGYTLVREAHRRALAVVPVPGACAAVAALSAAGLPSDRFCFEGFLPAKSPARRQRLGELAAETRTLIFYEAPHRIEECLADLVAVWGEARPATLARELTKTFETIIQDSLGGLLQRVRTDPDQRKGEFVLVVQGGAERPVTSEEAAMDTLRVLLDYLPLKEAASAAARLTDLRKNRLYELGLQLQNRAEA